MMDWLPVSKCDIRARCIADRHYSRQKIGAPQFTRPGNNLVFLLEDCSALWVSWKPANGISRMDDAGNAYECTIFRNEGKLLSSDLIKAAVQLTEEIWGKPKDGWITYIGDKVVKSVNKGYCFKMAGFKVVGRNKKGNLTKLMFGNGV
ncbi:hypothetical protein LCGC14_1439730 [marine sediment metagenome]|uniref:Uncharacterized protein n=1 Tax=marine sediment metagenome TaxID=412755 RepID=A0A0F9JL03_9ZZZZ